MPAKKPTAKKSPSKKPAAKKPAAKKPAVKKAPPKSAAKKSAPKKAPARKRELMEPHKGDKRYVRRDAAGQFKDVVDVGRSLAADRRSHAKKIVPKGQGDRGDTKR